MTRLRLYLRSSAKAARSNFLILSLILLLYGCSSSTSPTFSKDDAAKAIENICRQEYEIELAAKLAGKTLWVYLPLEDMIVKAEKPQKYSEKFAIGEIEAALNKEDVLTVSYSIQSIPEEEKTQDFEYHKKFGETINNVWKVIRRVLFSTKCSEEHQPHFFQLVIADIQNGFETSELFHCLDLKKVSYGFISWTEYQHRTVSGSEASPQIIGDKEGAHIKYRDISMEEFITRQIQNRIRMKFQKAEITGDEDIDKEIMRISIYTIRTYNFKDFNEMELANLVTGNKISLNRAAVWARSTE